MTVALLAKGIDAFVGWDPWPIVAQKDVPGAYRGDPRRQPYLLSRLQRRACATGSPRTGDAARNFWRRSPRPTSGCARTRRKRRRSATRWIPGWMLRVAEEAMRYNVKQVDRRLSANNYRRA